MTPLTRAGEERAAVRKQYRVRFRYATGWNDATAESVDSAGTSWWGSRGCLAHSEESALDKLDYPMSSTVSKL